MDWYAYTIEELKESKKFLGNIRWDITPRKFLAPRSTQHENKPGECGDTTVTYMMYVDEVCNKPSLMIMRIRGGMSKTAGYIEDAPEDMLREAMACKNACEGGMFPLTKRLENWLKKELGLF